MRLSHEQRQAGFIPGFHGTDGRGRMPSHGEHNLHVHQGYEHGYQRNAPPHLTPSQVTHSVPVSHYPGQNNVRVMQPQRSPRQRENEANRSANRYYHDAATKPKGARYPKNSPSQPPGSSQRDRPGSKSKAKPKLPHGLTVQELKEMTKARLQAESSEQDNSANEPTSRREGAPFSSPQPSLGRTAPPGFEGRSQSSNSSLTNPITPTWQQTPALDAWETASVASMNSSTYGSESAFPVSGLEEIPLGRSRSYGGVFERPRDAPSPTLGSGSYDFQGNRRRATTLSPRPGLSNLFEDRPLATGNEKSSLLSFQAAPGSQTRPGRSRGSSPANVWSSPGGGVIGSGLNLNRPRTASAPSLPSSYPTTGDSVYQASPASEGHNDFVSVFRNSPVPGSGANAPPGLFPRPESAASTIFETSDQVAWGSSSVGSQQGLLIRSSFDEEETELSASLNSILQLSGARDSGSAIGGNNLLPSSSADSGAIEERETGLPRHPEYQSGAFLSKHGSY